MGPWMQIAGGAMMGAGLIGGAINRRNKNKRISKMISDMPKYKISDATYENKNLATQRAFGRDQGITRAQKEADKNAADAGANALSVSNNTNDILSAISAIEANRASTKRNLAADEYTIRRQNFGDLAAANNALIDEQDKEFMQNKMAPWDAKMNFLQAKKEEAASAWGNLFQMGSQIAGNGGGGGGGGGMGGMMGSMGGMMGGGK